MFPMATRALKLAAFKDQIFFILIENDNIDIRDLIIFILVL